MTVNAKAEYALRAMMDLAHRPGERTTLRDIAARQRIPQAMLRSIVQTLAKAGLVETTRGYGGGVRLGHPAKQVSVRSVLEALEGSLDVHRCKSHRGSCPLNLGDDCPLRALWEETQARMLELWGKTSLADLVRSRSRANGGTAERRRASGAGLPAARSA